MRKLFPLVFICLYSIVATAQNVGIGTPNPLNKLHVAGGLRLDTLTGLNGNGIVTHNADGAIYGLKFSGNINDVLRGDGTFGSGGAGSVGWLLNGNSGTNPATHFLGTTDDASLVFKIRSLQSGLIDSALANSSFGYRSLSQNTNGSGNSVLGYKALFSNTDGARNTAVGNEALSNNVLGNDNTAVGYKALLQNIGAGNQVEPIPFRGVLNTAVGSNALSSNVAGSENSAFGANAMRLSTASKGSAFGAFALEKNASFSSSAFGYSSLQNTTTGNYNSGVGAFALYTNTTGYENTAVGTLSLYSNNSYYNSALGAFSLEKNTSGYGNTGLGYSAMNQNATGVGNTSVGAFSMHNNNSSANTAIGYKSMEQNVSGISNTATGYAALQSNQGSYNSAFGHEALKNNNNASASYNSAFGIWALKLNSGFANTAVGTQALENNVSGSFNTAVGTLSGLNLPNNVSNVTVIGYNTGWNTTSSNQVNIGNMSVGWIGGQVPWSTYSDKRMKHDIKDDVPGLAFITRLKPVTYHINLAKQKEVARVNDKDEKDWEGKNDIESRKMTGFLAQDVEAAAMAVNYNFSGVHKPKNGDGLYSLEYGAFVVPLVKAVQEQQQIIDKQQKQIDALMKRIEALEKK